MTGLKEYPVSRPGVDHRFCFAFPLHQESGTRAELRRRAILTKVPYERRDDVVPRMQLPGDVDSFVPPVHQVAARRSIRDFHFVDEQAITVVGRYAHDKPIRSRDEFEILTEMINACLLSRRSWIGDPLRSPRAVHDWRPRQGYWR
jgi:hypothetical protein